MQLVLLPGLDGTGQLFAPFLQQLGNIQTEVVPLPTAGAQDYQSLAAEIEARLPGADCVLLAESFSGPIAVLLAQRCAQIKGLVFVASALQPISIPYLSRLPVSWCNFLLRSSRFFRQRVVLALLPGNFAKKLRPVLESLLAKQSSRLLAQRLLAITQLNHFLLPEIHQPCLYLQAGQDGIVPHSAVIDFQQRCKKLRVRQLPASHFLLQTAPKEAAAYTLNFLSGLKPTV